MTDRRGIRRVLLSVYDKTGLEHLVPALHAAGAELVSTGSTAATVAALGAPVTPVEAVTGFPEMLGGRVKTLHPGVHAGLLADLRDPGQASALAAAGIEPFDLVVGNLYPFERASREPGQAPDEVVEQIDVGGPAMLRAAAKNHVCVAVVCDVADYPMIEEAVRAGGTTLEARRALAAKAFARTADYDREIAAWFARLGGSGTVPRAVSGDAGATAGAGAAERAGTVAAAGAALPDVLRIEAQLVQRLRYGENPHQPAALYAAGAGGLADARQLAGRQLSYNNLLDADAALRLVRELAERPFVVIVKHTNPCGAAVGATLESAYAAALAGDPLSAFGGIVGASRVLDPATAARIAEIHTEVVVAPGFEAAAREALAVRPGVRLLEVPIARSGEVLLRTVAGGLLAQLPDAAAPDDPIGWTAVAGAPPDPATLADLRFAWTVCAHVTSNAIVVAHDGAVVGIGAGQMSRVDAVRLAVEKAGRRAAGAVAASDAFFPFPDGVEALAAAGVRAVVHPGGSVRDAAVTAAAAEAGLSILHTKRRHFRH